MRKLNNRGFTLIELLIVIAIIGFLAAAILVAVDPVKRVEQSRDAQRWSEVNAVLNAILTKQVDEKAQFDGASIAPIITVDDADDFAQVIVRDATGIVCNASGTVPFCDVIDMDTTGANTACVAEIDDIAPEYIAELPIDPLGTGYSPSTGPVLGDGNTGYYIRRTVGGRIEIGSCYPERESSISVKR